MTPSTRTHIYRRPWAPALALAILSLAALFAGCSSSKKTEPAPEVFVQPIKPQNVPINFLFNGTVNSVKTVKIVPRVTGNLEKRYFIEGSVVQAGDKLYLIDPRPYEAELLAAEGALEKSRAALVYWNAEVERYTKLAKKGAASKEKMQSSIASRDETRADILTDEANVASAALNLSYTNITAPFTGRIQQTNYHVGDLITANEDTLTTLVQLDPIYVIFSISRNELFLLQELGEKGVTRANWQEYTIRVKLPNNKDYRYDGSLDFLSAAIDPMTDNLTVRAIFPNPSSTNPLIDLIPGQYVPVEMIVGTQKDAIMVPQTAVTIGQAGPVALVVDKEKKVEARPLKILREYQQSWVISKGLKAGDNLIVRGLAKVKPGITVDAKPIADAPSPDKSKDQAAQGGGKDTAAKPSTGKTSSEKDKTAPEKSSSEAKPQSSSPSE